MLHTSSGGPTRSVREAHALLATTAELAVECLSRLFSVAIDRLAATQTGYPSDLLNGSLTTPADLAASQWLGEQGAWLITAFRDGLREQANLFLESGAPTGEPAPRAPGGLEVRDYDETEARATIRALAQWVESLSQEEFYLFNHRLGFLCGQFALPPARNPFGPGRALETFDDAGRRIPGYDEIRVTLLRLLKRAGLEGAVSVYGTLNQFLLDQGVLPRFRPKMRRDVEEEDARLRAIGPITEEVEQFRLGLARLAVEARKRIEPDYVPAEEVAERKRQQAEKAAEEAREPDLLTERRPEPAQVVRMPRADWRAIAQTPRAVPAALPRRRATESILDAIRSSAVAERIGRIGAATLQITNVAFDQVLVSANLATPVRLLISRLQTPFYKAALVDKRVLSTRPHPVRMLLNRLSEAGVAWSPDLGEKDSLLLAMTEVVERLQRPARDEIALFEGELQRFDGFLDTETRAAKQAAIERARALYHSERNRVAYATASTELDRALVEEIYPPLPEFAERFARNTWVHTLREAYMREGKDGQLWQSNLDFLHELTWSLKPKPTESERRILLRMLPQLVERIRASLAQAHADRDLNDFLSELMQAHIYLVRKGMLPRHLRGGGVQPEGRRKVDYLKVLEKLDPNLAHRAPPPAVTVGSWVEFGGGTSLRYRKKLVWVSPLSHRALFTNRRGEGELVLAPDELQKSLGLDQVIPLRVGPMFDASLRSAKLSLGRAFPKD